MKFSYVFVLAAVSVGLLIGYGTTFLPPSTSSPEVPPIAVNLIPPTPPLPENLLTDSPVSESPAPPAPSPPEITLELPPVANDLTLDLNAGSFAGLPLGATADEIRLAAQEKGISIVKETPFGQGGTLINFGDINFRFSADGSWYQCYALGKNLAISGELKLQVSTLAEFEAVLGGTAKKGFTGGGLVNYTIRNSKFTFILLPVDANSKVIKSIMITKN